MSETAKVMARCVMTVIVCVLTHVRVVLPELSPVLGEHLPLGVVHSVRRVLQMQERVEKIVVGAGD